jgi:hypothetical protein
MGWPLMDHSPNEAREAITAILASLEESLAAARRSHGEEAAVVQQLDAIIEQLEQVVGELRAALDRPDERPGGDL